MDHGGMDHGGGGAGGHGGMDHGGGVGGDHGGMDHGGGGEGDHGGMDHGGGGGGGQGEMHHMMSMSFHFGVKETILFEWWETTTSNELLVAVFIVGVVAALYEGIKYFRESLLRSSSIARKSTLTQPGSTTALHCTSVEPSCAEAMFSCNHVVQTLLHAAQFTVSYLLMLVFMTYNVYLCMGVVAGAAIGFFLFGWRSSSLLGIIEHCH